MSYTEVVRCKDCKHYQFADNRAFMMPVKRCEITGFEDVDDFDFCSRAERKEQLQRERTEEQTMSRMFETKEITKLLNVLIGDVEAVGETNEDNRRLDNLKTLIDVTDWCLDGLQFAMDSGYGMAGISYTAQCALDEYGTWIAYILDEYVTDCENCAERGSYKCTKCDGEMYYKDAPQTDCETRYCEVCKKKTERSDHETD